MLKSICERSGTRVQLPKRDLNSAAEVDPEEMVEVSIEGDFDGADMARQEIEAIVADRTSSTSLKITSIPSDFYGLITLHTADWTADADLKIKVPSPSFTEDIPAAVTISGEKELVASTKERIEALFEELARTTIPTAIPIPKRQHRFIVPSINDILQQTGCAVIVPPPSSSSEHISIRGPGAKLGSGITLVMEKANSMSIDSLEISRAHASAPDQLSHAIDITKYMQKSGKLTAVEKEFSITISTPEGTELANASKVVYELSGKSTDNVANARRQLISLVNSFPPAYVGRIAIEPLLHKQVMGTKSKNVNALKKQHSVDVIFPALADNDSNVVVVYEGQSSQPHDISTAVAAAVASLEALVADAGEIASQTVQIPVKHHSHITGKNNTTLNAITGGSEAVVRVIFGDGQADAITVKGPRKAVDKVVKEIQTVAEEANDEEVANSHKVEFEFPPQFTKNLIGKGGANVSKLSEELGVKIDVKDEGRVTVQGPLRNAEEAKSRIVMLGERLQDETTLTLKVPAEFHGQIIGQGGKLVKRLEEKYQVQINFPRSGDSEEEGKVNKNEITVKGGKKGANSAKQEIMELFEYENEHSHTVTIEVVQKAIAQIVGKSGQAINDLKDETNTRIDIERTEAGAEPDARVAITIKGKKSDVERARLSIEEINKEVEDTVTRTLHVDPAHHRNLIGPGGINLRELVVKAGGPEDPALRARMVRFPRAGNESSEIVLKGPQKVVEKIAKAIEKLVGDSNSQHSESISVPKDQVKLVIGRGGSKKTELETTHSVVIDIPRTSDAPETSIKLIGPQENVEKAIKEITELVKVPESETIMIPRSLHRSIADGGAFIRRVRSDYKVSIDHQGHELPKVQRPTPTPNGARLDDEESEYGFSIQEVHSSESGDIPWTLKGTLDGISKASAALHKARQAAAQQTHIATLSVPAQKHRFIIGQGGSVINSIRETSSTRIDVPKSNSSELITIKGTEAGCMKARDMIIEAIK